MYWYLSEQYANSFTSIINVFRFLLRPVAAVFLFTFSHAAPAANLLCLSEIASKILHDKLRHQFQNNFSINCKSNKNYYMRFLPEIKVCSIVTFTLFLGLGIIDGHR